MTDQERTLKFVSEQNHMTIAVTLNDGTPWATPVRIKKWDGQNVFEWDSKIDTEHSKAIEVRPEVALSMWTPDAETTVQFGVYAQACAEQVSEPNDHGIARYKATITKCWINDASFVKREVGLA